MHEQSRGWDGSLQRVVSLPRDVRPLEVWDDARVVAGEPPQLCVLAVGDAGRAAHRWRLLAGRWAGVPFWGSGPPPVAAIGTGRATKPEPPPGYGPDGAPSWSTATRFIAVPGSRGDHDADTVMLRWAVTTFGQVDVLLGQGNGGRQVQLLAAGGATKILLDGGLPVGPDSGDAELHRSWTESQPTAVVVPADQPSRYDLRAVTDFLSQHPATRWRRVGGPDHRGIDHDRLIDSDYAAMVLPGIVLRVRNGGMP